MGIWHSWDLPGCCRRQILYEGNEEDMQSLIARAAELDAQVFGRLRTCHDFQQVIVLSTFLSPGQPAIAILRISEGSRSRVALQIADAVTAEDKVKLLELVEKDPNMLSVTNTKGRTPLSQAVE
eukprot:scaffold336356_cov45-Prasinocladus_malaysianus.AAC.1